MASGTDLSKLRLGTVLVGVLFSSMLVSIAPARADLRVCNETGNPVSIALGYRAERGWQSEGWWVAQATQCATVYQGKLDSRFFYLYVADDIGGGAWDGTVFMCTRDETFTIFGVEDCLARGYERTGFFEVDTQNQPDWTLQLTDPSVTPPEAGAAGDDSVPLDDVEAPQQNNQPPGEDPEATPNPAEAAPAPAPN
jgi:uncharacterized membrane protein